MDDWSVTMMDFDDCAKVIVAPRWLAPLAIWATRKLGERRVLGWCAHLPHSRERLGLMVLIPKYTTITSDRKHCLLMQPDWKQWSVYRALTPLQEWGWHGITVDHGTLYIGPGRNV